jgi:hypothetical protein
MIKKQNLTKFFTKNKSVNQLIMKLSCPMQHRRKYQSKILMKVLKLKSVNSKMSGSRSFRGSFMIPVMTLWIVIFAERQAQIFRLYYFKIWIKNLKLSCLESIVRFKRPDNLNWKMWSERERTFFGYINSPSGYLYGIFTCIPENYERICLNK